DRDRGRRRLRVDDRCNDARHRRPRSGDRRGDPDDGAYPVRCGYVDLKRRLSILSALIFDSSVDEGTPSRAAAPNGPDTRPLLSASAASMASFSCPASVLDGGAAGVGDARLRRPESQRSSIESVSESDTITARSMTFCSSRMLPGQSYNCRRFDVSLLRLRIRLPTRLE